MYKITLISIGKMKPGPLKLLADQYRKQLAPFVRIQTIELKQAPFKDASQKQQALAEEAQRILAALPDQAKTIFLTESGQTYTSESFAEKMAQWSEQQTRHLVFVIGGPLGLDKDLFSRHEQLALSPMTFTHEMAHVLFLEQAYRAMTILTGKTYHY